MSNRLFAGLFLLSSSALAQAPQGDAAEMRALKAAVTAAQSAGDNAWMLVSAALVLMMTGPGLALFYCGIRADSQDRPAVGRPHALPRVSIGKPNA